MRLSFLNIGPQIGNLDLPLTRVTSLFLQYNKISKIAPDTFQNMPSLKFLALQCNYIDDIG